LNAKGVSVGQDGLRWMTRWMVEQPMADAVFLGQIG